jgi:FdhD protein
MRCRFAGRGGRARLLLRTRVSARREAHFRQRRRTLAGRTGCGLCGTESLAQLQLPLPRVSAEAAATVAPAALDRAVAALAAQQPLQHLTGGMHAAAWCTVDGALHAVREDVGRHNALDKLIGALLRGGVDTAPGFALVTSRASFEMAQKAARAGMGLLAAMSAPTRLAIDTAAQAGVTLAAFVRDGRATIYSHPQRMAWAS